MKAFITNLISHYLNKGGHLRDFTQEDILKGTNVYSNLNWSTTIIGGSYALKQFTGDTWNANDIDILVRVSSFEEFENYIKAFSEATNSTYDPINNFDNMPPQSEEQLALDEKFHEAIKGSCKVYHPDTDKILQFVYLDDKNTNRSADSILAETSDLPSCVSYTWDEYTRQKIFHIPEKGREVLFNRVAKYGDVCDSRRQKYEDRGYFYMT